MYDSTKALGWEDIEQAFRGIFQRKWYTSHGPLLKELEEKLQTCLGVKHAICISNESHAFMIAIKTITPEKVSLVTPISSMLKKTIKRMQLSDEDFSDEEGITLGVCSLEEWQPSRKSTLTVVSPIGHTTGSCICTDDDALAERVRNTRCVPGIREKIHVFSTGNGRMSEAQAAIILLGLKKES